MASKYVFPIAGSSPEGNVSACALCLLIIALVRPAKLYGDSLRHFTTQTDNHGRRSRLLRPQIKKKNVVYLKERIKVEDHNRIDIEMCKGIENNSGPTIELTAIECKDAKIIVRSSLLNVKKNMLTDMFRL
jgi:hypothetical protein